MKNKKIFITGVAGFIGFHLSNFFLKKGFIVFGIDNLNAYYSVALKKKRLSILKKEKKFFFKKIELENKRILKDTIKKFKPHLIINLAAQPGVRYSYIRPEIYLRYNLNGFLNLLEVMSELRLNKLIYASSSSVYGDAKTFPTNESSELKPLNLYGETKVINEQIAQIYSKYYNINSFGLRFFTAYGSLGRPDMMISKSIRKIREKEIIYLHNHGNHTRDFTHVYDIAEIIFILSKKINVFKGHELFNICSNNKIKLNYLIKSLEKLLRLKSITKNIKKQKGDMLDTLGDNKKIKRFSKKKKFINFDFGLKETIENDAEWAKFKE